MTKQTFCVAINTPFLFPFVVQRQRFTASEVTQTVSGVGVNRVKIYSLTRQASGPFIVIAGAKIVKIYRVAQEK